MPEAVSVISWGLIDYARAMRQQAEVVRAVAAGGSHTLIFCEHPRTLTLGRAFHAGNMLAAPEQLEAMGFTVVRADRGGDVTLHAPGQLMVYPVVDLKRAERDLTRYLQKLEEASVDFLRDFGIVAKGAALSFDGHGTDDGHGQRRGVWVGREKIASIGIGVSRWVTYHGIGINITTDLSLFRVIRPCGLDVRMTSLKQLTGLSPVMSEAAGIFAEHFTRVLP